MSDVVGDNLSREKVRQLLAAVGSRPEDDTTQVEAAAHNWREPHYFTRQQLCSLESFKEELAEVLAEKFAQLYKCPFDVTITSTTQHFAGGFFEQILSGEQSDYYLAFNGGREHACGFLAVPEQTAVSWVTQLLGGSESEKDAGKGLSHLEESFLLDIGRVIVAALSACLRHSPDFELAGAIVRSELPVELPDLEVLCKVAFAVRKTGSEKGGEAYMVVPCSQLASVTGNTAENGHRLSNEDIAKAIIEHLGQMPVTITAHFARTVLTFGEMMSLQPGDILLLDKAMDEPVELRMGGRTFFRGRPAQSSGQYAVVITESVCCKAQNMNPALGR